MKSLLVLIYYSFKRIRTIVLVMGFVLALFQVFLVVIARSIEQSGSFEQMGSLIPPFLRQLIGPAFSSFMSFKGMVSLGYFHLSVIASLIGLAIAIATMPASEVENGFMDLLLSRPVARRWIITRTIITLVFCLLLLLILMALGTWIGLNSIAPKQAEWPAPGLIGKLALNLWLLALCWGSVGLVIGAASRRRSVAGSTAGFLALITFLLDYVARAWSPAESVAWLSPFRYFSPLDIVTGKDIPAHHLLILSSVIVAGFVVAYSVFSRRDI